MAPNGDNVYFDICSKATTTCPGDSSDSFAVRIDGSADCKHLAGYKVDDINFTAIAKNETANVTEGVKLSFTGGDNDA